MIAAAKLELNAQFCSQSLSLLNKVGTETIKMAYSSCSYPIHGGDGDISFR